MGVPLRLRKNKTAISWDAGITDSKVVTDMAFSSSWHLWACSISSVYEASILRKWIHFKIWFLIFIHCLKVISHLQLLQSIGYIPRVVQDTPAAYLISNSWCLPPLCCPCPPHWYPLTCSLYLWVCFFVLFTSLSYFLLDSIYKWYMVCGFLRLIYLTWRNISQVHQWCCKGRILLFFVAE